MDVRSPPCLCSLTHAGRCDPVYSARHVILEFLNIVRLIVGSVIATWNAVYAFEWSLVWVFVRVTIDCTIENGPLVLEQFGEDLGIALELLFTAVADYLEGKQGPLLTSGIDFEPFVEQIGVTANTTAILLNCACLYLNWTWTAAFELVGDPALAQAVNGTANAALAAFLSPFVAINFTQAPQINLVVANLQSALLGLGEWIEDALLVLFIVLINIIDLIGWIFTMQGAAAPPRLSDAFSLRAQTLPIPVPLENITGLVILQKVLEAPWAGVITNTACFALALLNNTWSLSLLITNAKLNSSDLAYFQMGYIFDWLRAASLCLGQVFAALDPALEFAVSGLVDVVIWAVQIAIEITIQQIFFLAYAFLSFFPEFGIDATLFGASFYCQANNTAATSAYASLLNNSAAFAILVGCNASTQLFPMDTLGATCEDNPAGCIVLSTYRFLVETVNVLELTLCALPQLVTFNSNLTVAANISIDGMIREGLHFGRCLRVLLYVPFPLVRCSPIRSALFDNPDWGSPPGPCEFLDDNGRVQFKRSFWCGLGVALKSSVYAIIAALYQILNMLQAVFTSFAIPSYATNIRLPTFLASLSDVQTAFCGLAAAIAGLLPLTFSCSAQLDTSSGSNNVPLPPTPNPWGQPVELAPLNQRDPNMICSFNRFAWSSGGTSACNCNSSIWRTFTFAQLATTQSTPACTLECAQDLWDPIFFGAPYLPSAQRALVAHAINARVDFSNTSTLVAFLPTAEYPLSSAVVYPFGTVAQPNNYALGPVLDPSPVDPTFGGGEWLAQLLTGMINDRVTSTFNSAQLVWNPAGNMPLCINSTMPFANTTNPRIAAAFNAFLFQPLDGGIRVSDYVAVINLFVFGSGLMTGFWQTNQAFINSIFQTGTPANTLATSIMNLAAAVYPNGSAAGTTVAESTGFYITVLAPVLEYNGLFPGNGTCTGWPYIVTNASSYETCFINDGVIFPEPSGPIIAPLPTNLTVQAGVTPILCTYAPTDWLGPTGGCDCTFPAQYQHYGSSPVCTLFCDPPSYPLFVGALPADCLLPGTCSASIGGNFFNYADVVGGLGAVVGGLDNQMGEPLIVPLVNTPNFYKNFLSTALSLYYLRRHNPTQYIYFRTLDDPLYGANCIANTTDQQLWAGVNVEVMLRIINTTFFGDDAVPNRTTCLGFYQPTSTEFTVCSNFVRQYPQVRPPPSTAHVTHWGARSTARRGARCL